MSLTGLSSLILVLRGNLNPYSPFSFEVTKSAFTCNTILGDTLCVSPSKCVTIGFSCLVKFKKSESEKPVPTAPIEINPPSESETAKS